MRPRRWWGGIMRPARVPWRRRAARTAARAMRARRGCRPSWRSSQPGDVYEQEADRIAGQIVQTPAMQVQRRAASGPESTDVPPIVHEVLRSPGQPLDAADARVHGTALRPRLQPGAGAFWRDRRPIGAGDKRGCLYGGAQHRVRCGPVQAINGLRAAADCPRTRTRSAATQHTRIMPDARAGSSTGPDDGHDAAGTVAACHGRGSPRIRAGSRAFHREPG